MYRFLLPLAFLLLWNGTAPAQGVLDSIGTYFFSEEGDSIYYFKKVYSYHPSGEMASVERNVWDENRRSWRGTEFPLEECYICPGRHEYTYDDRGNLTQDLSYAWRGIPETWRPAIKENREYDVDNKLVSNTWAYWDQESQTWDYTGAYEYTYLQTGNVATCIHYSWYPDAENWSPNSQEVYSYNTMGFKISEIFSRWNWQTRVWENAQKTEWTYLNDSILTGKIYSNWELSGTRYSWKEWERFRFEYSLDSLGRRERTTGYAKIPGRDWSLWTEDEWSFTPNGQPASLVKKSYSTYYQKWTESERKEWTYNDNHKLITEIHTGTMMRIHGLYEYHRVIRQFSPAGDTLCETYYFPSTPAGSWQLGYKDYFFHRNLTGRSDIVTDSPINFFPNPTAGPVHITGLTAPAELRIWSMQGQLMRKTNQTGETADLTGLPKGMYILELKTVDGKVQRSRIIRE